MKLADSDGGAFGRMVPLTPAVFYILFSLADGDKHGYAIMQETVKLSEGEFRMGPATLYTNIQRLLAAGLIKEVSGGGTGEQDARRRYYRLTRQGRALMEQELERMRKLLRRAQGSSLLPKAAH
jgi:DNA-binding PadR family transcriptional regulator